MVHHHGLNDKSHTHHHSHEATTYNRAFLIAIIANGLFVLCQIFFAISSNSTSLLADAFHNLGDVLGLVMAWVANGLLTRMPTLNTTYGLKKTSILAALCNGALLIFTCGIIASEALYKLYAPSEVQALPVMIVAVIGIVVNGTTAMLFLRGSKDLNIRAAFLHLLYDAIISAGVVVAAALIYWTNYVWIDAIVGLLIAIVIVKGTWSLFSDSFLLIIDGVPNGISSLAVKDMLASQPGVKQVHDLHIWALSTKENALSVHLWMPEQPFDDAARKKVMLLLKEQYNIHHTTIQIEQQLEFCDDACALEK